MQAYLSVKLDFTDEDIEKIKVAQFTLSELRDVISKTGLENETKNHLQDTIDILTDIVMTKEIV